jgi:hypothetical protein
MMISRRPAALMPDGPSGQWRAFRQVRVTAWLSTVTQHNLLWNDDL